MNKKMKQNKEKIENLTKELKEKRNNYSKPELYDLLKTKNELKNKLSEIKPKFKNQKEIIKKIKSLKKKVKNYEDDLNDYCSNIHIQIRENTKNLIVCYLINYLNGTIDPSITILEYLENEGYKKELLFYSYNF